MKIPKYHQAPTYFQREKLEGTGRQFQSRCIGNSTGLQGSQFLHMQKCNQTCSGHDIDVSKFGLLV